MATSEPLKAYRERLRRFAPGYTGPIALVQLENQTLSLFARGTLAMRVPVSTSRYGAGAREGSFMTPRGIHRIAAKIGAGAPAGRIFKDRLDTGKDWTPGEPGENLILTRILRLEGLEPGVNRGPGIDSFDRYIYIHGTNKEEHIGTPLSHGCVCMRNQDIIALFDRVAEGVIVIID